LVVAIGGSPFNADIGGSAVGDEESLGSFPKRSTVCQFFAELFHFTSALFEERATSGSGKFFLHNLENTGWLQSENGHVKAREQDPIAKRALNHVVDFLHSDGMRAHSA
jgi:hypothetical protein